MSRIHHFPWLDLTDPDTWPENLRLKDICRDSSRQYPGILPLTSSAFRAHVERGVIRPPIKFGEKIDTWSKQYILYLRRHGIPATSPDTEMIERRCEAAEAEG